MNDKLGEKNVKNLLDSYEIVFLTEIKTSQKISCSGLTVFQNSAKKGHRGGVALSLKPILVQYVKNMDRSYENVISFELDFMEGVLFVGVYITPTDSPYYDDAIFGYLQSILKKDGSKTVFILGDLNSRVGIPKDLKFGDMKLNYSGCNDNNTNENGRKLLDMCRETFTAVVSNVHFGGVHFKSKLSFRRKSDWISETDVLVTSEKGMRMLESFDMVQYHNGGHLYSDHALLQFGLNIDIHTNTGVLLQRAMNLGVSMHEIGSIKIDKTLRVSQCDAERVKL